MKREYGVIEVTHYRVMANGKVSYYTKFIEIGDGYAKVMKNDKWGVINNKGVMVCPMSYKYIGDSSSGIMVIYDAYRYGYFSKETGQVWPCIFEMVYPFIEDTAKVIYEGKERIVNKKGKFADEVEVKQDEDKQQI